MKVFLPSPLRSYAGGRSEVEGRGGTVAAVLEDLDRRHPGIRFRMVNEQGAIREHIQVFVRGEQVKALSSAVGKDDEVYILAALSGG